MALINKDVILNSNPTKRLRIAFENMKSNYNDSTARAYMDQYKDQSIAFIIENSRYIFSEPMYGLKFYIETILSNDHALIFTEYENEKEKVKTYLDENGKNMPDAQRKLYEDLVSLITKKCKGSINTILIISHACEDETTRTEYNNLVDAVYWLKSDPQKIHDIITFMKTTKSPDLFYALSPYLVKFDPNEINYAISSNIGRFFKECTIEDRTINDDEWKRYIESVVIVSKLYNDTQYKDAVSTMRRQNSIIFDGLASESIKDQINELFIEHITENAGANKFNVNTSFDCYYSTAYNAVNRIFEDDFSYDIMKEENAKSKMHRTQLCNIAMNTLFEYVTYEYQNCDNLDDHITGYNYFTEGTSIASALSELSVSPYIITENEDIDVDDDVEDLDDEDSDPKKAIAPEAKNLANKVQHKAMDDEAKFLKKKAVGVQKGQEVKNAAKAVTAIPKNIIDSIKNFFSTFDRMDDQRRKEYIRKPGYRKKIFRNMKLAILYGSVASYRLTMIPFVFMMRSLSKEKDKRMRNELAREIDTNIKVCEAKIEDAAQKDDRAEKYRLMRIKAKLEEEALRVKSNSKYI